MKQIRKLMLGAVAVLAASLLPPAQASAQTYPTQRVTIVVPLGAGGVTDILARIFAEDMARRWGQPVIVENRPGINIVIAGLDPAIHLSGAIRSF